MATDLLREKLPPGCQLGVTQDGRVFFIDDQQQTTSWVHPVSGLPVLTGLQGNPDLPRGWEQDVTNDGLVYYVDHSRRITTFQHPKHGTADVPDTSDSNFIPFPEIALHPESPTSPSSPGNKTEQFKRGTVKQRSVRAPSSKRNPDSEVIKRGWLYRLETNGLLKSWKIRWCVLADFALFIYKGDDEAVTLNSILLPSYRIIPCTEADNIKRNFVFKVEHENTKTLYFATEDSAELVSWMSHLQQAAMMNGNGFHREPVPNMRQHPLKASNKPPGFSQQFSDPPHSLDKNPRNSQSSSYRGYGDPASPLATPTDGGSFAIGYGHPNNPSSKHNSLSNSSPRGSQAHSHSSNRDQIFNPDQSRASGSFHGNTDNGDPRRHSNSHHQQQPQSLRDGFAPDSARNSLAQSDSSRVGPNWYNPAQAERQRLNQGPVQGHVDPRNDNSQRDSYSDFDGPVKQLHRWDEGFPNTETEKLKHMSFVDLMEGGRGRQPDTFNARSKSHENFSRLSDSKPQQHPPQQRGGSSNHSFHQHGPSGPQDRSGLNQYQGNMDRSRPSLSQDLRDGRHQQHQDWGSKGRENPDSKQQAGVGPPYHPQQEFQNNQRASDPKLSGDPMRGSVRDTSQPKHNPGQDRSSFTSNSSTSGAPPGYRDSFNHSYSTHPNTAGQQQQQQPRNQNPLPKPHSQFSPQKSDLHLNLQQQPYSSGSNPHIYVNFPNRAPGHSDQAPLRPPYPTAARQKIVEELAETKTPVTQKDFLTSSQLNTQRMQQPPYFQYPSPRDNQAPNRTDQSNVPSQRPVPRPRNQSNSRLPSTGQSSGLPSTSQSSRLPSTGQPSPGAQESPHSPQDSFSRTNMMDPEAQKLRMAYERVHSLRSAPDKAASSWYYDHPVTTRPGPNQQRFMTSYISPHHRAYKSQDELDRYGKISPPMGSYCRIPDEPEDLYSRGSAFRPPSTLSGSQQGLDSLQRVKYSVQPVKPARSHLYGNQYNMHSNQYNMYSSHDDFSGRPGCWDETDYYNIQPGIVRNGNFDYRIDSQGRELLDEFRPDFYPISGHEHAGFRLHAGHTRGGWSDRGESSDRGGWSDNWINRHHAREAHHYPQTLSAPPRRKPAAIQTVKEDPNMSDRDVLETNLQKVTKKNPLAGPRLRMSISAGDLIGKTHDELVLFLIQLRRNQAALENTKDWYRTQTEQRRALEMEYRKQVNSYGHVQDRKLLDNHQQFLEAKAQTEEIEGKLEVYKPIINLLDNMVTMGSLYGGDNLMLATQYRKHLLRPDQYQPPKKMLEFSRKHQEERLIQETEAEIKQLSSDEVDLEEKIDRLNELDRLLQEQSFKVSSFKEDKELMEKALTGVLRQQDQSSHDPREMRRLTQQQRTLEKEISRVTQQLAEASKELEQTSAENNKLEHEVALLRTKVYGELTRSKSAPSLASETVKTKMMMEKELAKVEGIMQGLSKEGARLSQAMSTIRRSSSSSQLAAALDKDDVKAKSGSYLQTDLDSGEQVDLATTREGREEDNSKPTIYHQRQNAGTPEDWEIEDADENTKRFFGLMPREKPKGLTVRDVKRQAEQRKEKERQKKDGDDTRDGEDVKLLVSNVDNEASSIIHARIPADGNGPVQWDTGLPLYENLPRYGPVSAVAESHSAPGSRRSSLILMAPKPFTPYQDKSARPFRSELALNASGDPLFTSNVNGNNKHSLGEGTSDVRPYHSVEMLNKPQQDNDKGESHSYKDRNNNGVSNPYENDYPSNNTFGSKHQLSTGQQFHSVPFVPQQAKQSSGRDAPVSNQGGSQAWKTTEKPEWSDQDPPPSADHITRPANFLGNQPLAYTARPWAKSSAEWDSNLFNVKKSPRGRHLTISSSEPLRLEMTPTLHSTAGDLFMNKSIDDVPDIVKSSQTKVDQIDADMIDREILYVPEKVLIPERYDAEADAEHLTEEDKMRRRERGERIKRVLASQSVLSLSQQDVSKLPPDNIHRRVEEEKRERAHYLTLNQELARQVTLQTKKQAAERRKTWSGAQFAEAKRQYEKSPV